MMITTHICSGCGNRLYKYNTDSDSYSSWKYRCIHCSYVLKTYTSKTEVEEEALCS